MRLIRLLILIVAIGFLMFSFSFFRSKIRDHETIANEIMAKVAKKIVKKHKMDWVGEGGGMMKCVYMIGLSFQLHHPMDQNEARERIVDCVEEILSAINENTEIRPFLKNYPFTTKNLQVSIFSRNADGTEVFDPYITVASVYEKNTIYYSTSEPNKVTYKNRYSESYSEALARVKGKTCDLSNKSEIL